jgi:enoyl-CoA hydratase
MSESEEVLLVERRELQAGPNAIHVEIWTVNRPDKLNALNTRVLERLHEEGLRLKEELARDLLTCRALILKGAKGDSGGKAFVAGADIAEMKDFDSAKAEAFSRLGQEAFGRLEELPIPTVALIEGFALGGGLELAMACDMLVATPRSQFGQPEAQLGLIPGFGATARFVDRLGAAKALELLYSGSRIGAQEAFDRGLVNRLLPEEGDALEESLKFVVELTSKSGPKALALMKKIVQSHARSRLGPVLEAEARGFGEIFETLDKREGVTAFLEKRKALFRGR